MPRLTHTWRARLAQIHASTLFAVILAIIAGLIFAWVFKMVFLNQKPKPITAPTQRRLTVAATNLLDKMQINNGQVKTISVSEEEYNAVVNDPRNRSRVLLTGNQPVGRTTIKSIRAEEAIFEDQLEPLSYPETVAFRLGQGMRAVNVDLPPTTSMIQVGDRVDVVCTLANDNALATGNGTITAILAKRLRVVARFGTTRTAATPPASGPRSYTLEATPYRSAVINLAKQIGGQIQLNVVPRTPGDDSTSIAAADTSTAEDPQTDRVTTEDLARIFGIQPPAPPAPIMAVERYSGTRVSGAFHFPGYLNYHQANGPGEKGSDKPAGNGVTPANGTASGTTPANNPANNTTQATKTSNVAKPTNEVPGVLQQKTPITPASTGQTSSRQRVAPMVGSALMASGFGPTNNYGFRPVGAQAATENKSCPTCGNK